MGVRVDKWVWAARCFKTRSKASAACAAGHVRVNGSVAKSSQQVNPGDMVDVKTAERQLKLEVVELGERRGSPEAAAKLFKDHSPPPVPYVPPPVARERGAGRPTKRDRRRLAGDKF